MEARQLAVRDLDAILEPVGQLAEPGAEHQPEPRREAGRALGDRDGRGGHAARCSGPKDSGSSSPSVVVRRTRSRSARWIGASSAANSRSRWRQPPHGVHELVARRRDDDLGDRPAAARDERADRRRLRALALRVGGVLHVRAGVAAAVGGAHGGADGEVRVRRVGAAGGLARQRQQLRVGLRPRGDQRVGVGALAQRVVADPEQLAQLGDLRALAAQVGVRSGDRLELEERAEPADARRGGSAPCPATAAAGGACRRP